MAQTLERCKRFLTELSLKIRVCDEFFLATPIISFEGQEAGGGI